MLINCSLCGKARDLSQTECCSKKVCVKCEEKHSRFTLCGSHHNESHSGTWQDCAECRGQFPTEMYVWHGTNNWNFEKLQNPPSFEPTHCSVCGKVIRLPDGGYSKLGPTYWCGDCAVRERQKTTNPRIVERGK
jgi:hypothetical protein